jgi:epoxide hydrolase
MTRIDGLSVHFLHLRSPRPDAIPLIMTHGWPGSFLELERTLGPLSDPAAHGDDIGYERFLAQGSDWGTSVSTSRALQHPGRLLGLHLVPPLAPPDRSAGDLTDAERVALADLEKRTRTGSGYSAEQGAQRRFENIVYWNEPDRGGHFAAWEQPGLFIDEVRAVARGCQLR